MVKPSRIRIGEVLNGRWHVLRNLGHGGMGAVYEAEHVTNGRRAAIKVMLPKFAKNTLFRKVFEREGRLNNEVEASLPLSVRKTSRPVEVYDSGTLKDGSPYMVMELLTGETVEERAEKRGGKLSMKGTVSILDATLKTIEGAHKQGVIHRDIKPENLFLTPGGNVRVLDFGLAKQSGQRDYLRGSGTPGFMPQEQARGESVGPTADVYGVGATGYRLLTGKSPTPASKPSRRQPHVRANNPGVPPRVAAVIDRAVAPQAQDRYPTARAMRKDLEDAVAPDAKVEARERACAMFAGGGYGNREITIRANGIGTPWHDDDLAAIAAVGPDGIVVPKVNSVEDVRAIESGLERHGAPDRTRIWAMLETPIAMLHAEEICSSSERLAVLVMGTSEKGSG